MAYGILIYVFALAGLSSGDGLPNEPYTTGASRVRCDPHETARLFQRIESTAQGPERTRYLESLASYVGTTSPECISERDIAVLAHVLSDDGEDDRIYAASIIGRMGSRGRLALPALQRELSQRPCEGSGINSAAIVRQTIEYLGSHPLTPRCFLNPFSHSPY